LHNLGVRNEFGENASRRRNQKVCALSSFAAVPAAVVVKAAVR